MTYYQERTGEPFRTTAVYPNRRMDQARLERRVPFLEEHGNPDFVFFTKAGTKVAAGYLRVVYGDHGPYVEFLRTQILWLSFECKRSGVGWYDDYRTTDGCDCKLYLQRKSVRDLPNPPAGPFSFENNCTEGYADYRPGRCYISPYQLKWQRINKIERQAGTKTDRQTARKEGRHDSQGSTRPG